MTPPSAHTHTQRERAIYRYVHSRNYLMDLPWLPIPDAPPTCPTLPRCPHPACLHSSPPCLYKPVQARHSWHHHALHPFLPCPPGPLCPPLPPGLPGRPALPCLPQQHQPLPDPSLLRAVQMRHNLHSCWQCSRVKIPTQIVCKCFGNHV